MSLELDIGDVVKLKKPHPCGGSEWVIYRVGADIGVKCQECCRRVFLARPIFEKRVKKIVHKARKRGSLSP